MILDAPKKLINSEFILKYMFRDRRKKRIPGDDEDPSDQPNSEENGQQDENEEKFSGIKFDPNNPDLNDIEKQLNGMFRNMFSSTGDPNFNFPFARIMEDIMKKMTNEMKETMEKQNGQPPTPEQMADLIRKSMENQGLKGPNINGPFVFGFNMNLDKDGKVRFNPIGNIKQKHPNAQDADITPEMEISESRDPVIDVFEEKELITIIAEMPGVSKDEIKMEFEEDSLILSAKNDETQKNYYSKVKLPSKINPKEAKARFTNGILELKIKKK